jgi:uncharacterized protein (DUF1330 family)
VTAYFLFGNLEITDPGKLERYKAQAGQVMGKYGGRYVALGGRAATVEGTSILTFPVMIEFPGFEEAQEWYESPDYHELKDLRLSAGRFNAIIIESLRPPPQPRFTSSLS